METPRQKLRVLLDAGKLVLIPQCYSALTARIAQASGFQATYLGGHAVATMHYGLPDYGVATISEMVDVAARIQRF